MSNAIARVAEYLRQRKLQNKDLGNVIHGVFTDPKAEMADLTIPDVEEVLAGAVALEELEIQLFITRQYLLTAISQLPRKELKITLTEQAALSKQPFKLQAKQDDKGTTFFRAVKTFG